MDIRPAEESEADQLTALAMAAKAHWGYAPGLLDAWRPQLTVTAQDIRAKRTFVATDGEEIAGFYSIAPADEAEAHGPRRRSAAADSRARGGCARGRGRSDRRR